MFVIILIFTKNFIKEYKHLIIDSYMYIAFSYIFSLYFSDPEMQESSTLK